ncbi:MAG: hypothetical protein M5U12_06410 [Verrucomicrobia bacterium]|nr:hypothetical protein [Verrucomicrobiota bacterium]
MYADDNYGWLPGVLSGSYPGSDRWVSGWLDFSSSPDNTNTLYLTDLRFSQLAPLRPERRHLPVSRRPQ